MGGGEIIWKNVGIFEEKGHEIYGYVDLIENWCRRQRKGMKSETQKMCIFKNQKVKQFRRVRIISCSEGTMIPCVGDRPTCQGCHC